VLVASHDRELLEQVPRILELSASGLRSYGGIMRIIKPSAMPNSRLPARRWNMRQPSANAPRAHAKRA
jgi:ATPase subunit of ABC transporter with duplicated ATPase domains